MHFRYDVLEGGQVAANSNLCYGAAVMLLLLLP